MIPHLRHPFQIINGKSAVVDQDSTQEIAQSVYAVLATEPGDRDENPTFGFESQLFVKGGVDLDELQRVVEESEPRASILTEAQWDGLLETVRVEVSA